MSTNLTTTPVERSSVKKYLSLGLKIGLTLGSLYFVFKKVDIRQVTDTMASANVWYFLLALLAFNISKLISVYRLKAYLQAIGVHLNDTYNIRLLYVGMFYNLFLPGSIGGDGYKIYLIRQQYNVKTKYVVGATLLDRVSGLALLLLMAGVFLLLSTFAPPVPQYHLLVIVATLLVLPTYFIGNKLFFPVFLKKFRTTTHLSFWVQIGQVATAVLLLLSVSVNESYTDYLTLFMISSVVAVFPFTIGGVGARELVFLYGYQYLNIHQETAITFTLLFFFVTAITALIGLAFSYNMDRPQEGTHHLDTSEA